MKTYFVRHSSELDIDKKTLEALWNSDYIGIHYPHDATGENPGEDSYSLDPGDYSGKARHNLTLLTTIGRDGGFVFGAYRGIEGGKIGYIEPGTKVELFSGTWGNKNSQAGRDARLKVLKLKSARNLTAFESLSLTSVQPRQGTLCQWKKVGGRVESLVSGTIYNDVGSLTPDLQEVMCMEFLRSNRAEELGLPQLIYTLAPVGRTLKDLDILAVGKTLKPIAAQVTYHNISSDAAIRKLNKLNPYGGRGSKTILFCRCENIQHSNGHIIFPLELVFREFCQNTPEGVAWFKMVAGA